METTGRRLRIGISGSYGGMNLGDEAILDGMLSQLRATVPADAASVLTAADPVPHGPVRLRGRHAAALPDLRRPPRNPIRCTSLRLESTQGECK